ncbi:DUF488 domain-containing protein [bacterium]|nr:MAG: DUF488 domain-containing protein [bacterium]
MLIYTIGHSTRTLEEFQKLLQQYRIEMLLDVRTVPSSRHVPHFNAESLRRSLERRGVEYYHFKGLGGLRKPAKDSRNTGWRNSSFRGFADYMQTAEFQKALAQMMELASTKRAALMCAEAVPWRCHRSLIADALLSLHHGEVRHIISETSVPNHELTPFAAVEEGRLTYPETDAPGRLI